MCSSSDVGRSSHITVYSITTPGSAFGIRLNALNNRIYKIVASLKGVPTSDRFEIETNNFQSFHSNLISFSKNYAHSYSNADFRIKFDQQERNMILEKTVRF